MEEKTVKEPVEEEKTPAEHTPNVEEKEQEAVALRQELSELNKSKEKYYNELRIIRQSIKEIKDQISVLREERDQLTNSVKELKEERSKQNKEVKEKVRDRKEAEKKKKDLLSELNIRQDPVKLKHQIEALELKLETEPMKFSKEEQLRKKIKELQTHYKSIEKVGDEWKEIKQTLKEFSSVRGKAEDTHKKIQSLAQKSQEKHEEMNHLYDKIRDFRKKEQPVAEEYLKYKLQYNELKKKLGGTVADVKEKRKVVQRNEARNYKKKVQQKTAEVKDKLKKRKKLSTEDILTFQAIDE